MSPRPTPTKTSANTSTNASTNVAPKILIVGATGGAGQAFMTVCLERGWPVTALTRRTPDNRLPATVHQIAGDALSAADVCRAATATGPDIIFHGANPPGYRHWAETAPKMLAASIAAARQTGARLLFPGNVYNFGPDSFPLIPEGAPQAPISAKGAVRVQMEEMLARAAQDGVSSTILRAGDFFSAHSPGSWLSAVMVRTGRPLRRVTYPGCPNVGHTWAYLPDLAEAAARLVETRDRQRPFEVCHFAGHHLDRGIEIAEIACRAAGLPTSRIGRFPWPLVRLAAPFVPLFREILEMRYLWRADVALDNRRLVELIGAEPRTPLDRAMEDTLRGLGCLPGHPATPRLGARTLVQADASAASTPAAT